MKEILARTSVLIIFILSVIMIQITSIYFGIIMAAAVFIYSFYGSRESRALWITISIYMIGYWIAYYLKDGIISTFELTREAEIVLSRFSLLGLIIPYYLFMKFDKPKTNYFSIGRFSNTIHFPFIWRGIKDPIWRFMLIGSVIIILSFSFVIDFGRNDIYQLLLYGVLFAFVNSILEEILWRGLILPRFVDYSGEKLGLIISSIGFGFYHYSIGFPWLICALFSLTGILLGGVTIRSQGLLPVIILHFIMNIAFALAGVIF
jgi:uncharacterized protein